MVRYLFYTIGDLTYQSPLVLSYESVYSGQTQTGMCYDAHNVCRYIYIRKCTMTQQHTLESYMVINLDIAIRH